LKREKNIPTLIMVFYKLDKQLNHKLLIVVGEAWSKYTKIIINPNDINSLIRYIYEILTNK
jgi:hypothetical protein